MAETIDYKVRIDTSSLADQLQQVKSQIDQAMATYTFRTAMPDPQPQSYAFPEARFVSQLNPGVGAGQAVDTGRAMVMQDMNSLYQSTRLGFHKFSQDAMNLALTSQLGMPGRITNYAELNMPNFNNMGVLRQGAAQFGFGYDPHMALGLGDYQRYAQNAFSDNGLSSFLRGSAHMMLNTATAAGIASPILNYLGATTSGAIAGGVSAVLTAPVLGYEMARPDYEAYLNMRGAARDTSWRFLSGRFSNQESSRIAMEAVHFGRSENLLGRGMGLADVQETMRSYTEAGGFDFVHNSREFSSALKTIVESITQGSQALRMSRDEYARFHTQMTRMGLAGNTQEALGLQTTIAAQALGAGYTAQELTQFGLQSAEMVRGTGISLGSAFLGGASLLSDIRAMARSGGISTETIQQMGGFENAASTVNRIGYQFGQSSAGFTLLAAESYYGSNWNAANASPTEAMMGAIGRVGSPRDYLRMKGTQAARLSAKNGEELFLDQTSWEIQQLHRVLGENVGQADWIGYATGTLGYDNATAKMKWQMANSAPQSTVQFAAQSAANIAATGPGVLQKVADGLGNAIAEAPIVQGAVHIAQGYQTFYDNVARDLTNLKTFVFDGYTKQKAGPAMDDVHVARTLTNPIFTSVWEDIEKQTGVKLGAHPSQAAIEGAMKKMTTTQRAELTANMPPEVVRYHDRDLSSLSRVLTESGGGVGAFAGKLTSWIFSSDKQQQLEADLSGGPMKTAVDNQRTIADKLRAIQKFTTKEQDAEATPTEAVQGGAGVDAKMALNIDRMWRLMNSRGINVNIVGGRR
jgi:hypothetical protein